MEVLSTVCYIIGLPSAIILIIFRTAHKEFLRIFFPDTFYLMISQSLLFKIVCPIHNTKNTVYQSLGVFRMIIISFLAKSLSRNVTHSLRQCYPKSL